MSLFYSDALAVSHLRLQDWIYLGVSILQASHCSCCCFRKTTSGPQPGPG